MSGRAGRRGMDEIGYVTVVGTQFQTPEEVAELVLSDANPLESRFSPSYSMVLNLLQRFSLDEAKELILKSFGYFSSGSRLKPLLQLKSSLEGEIRAREFVCPSKLTDAELHEYDKLRHIYVQNRQTYKKITKQERSKNRPLSAEVVQFGRETKAMLEKMHNFPCDTCKLYKKHSKNIEVIERLNVRQKKLEKERSKIEKYNRRSEFIEKIKQMKLEDNELQLINKSSSIGTKLTDKQKYSQAIKFREMGLPYDKSIIEKTEKKILLNLLRLR